MKFIAHRGNSYGKQEKLENQPGHVDFALNAGYDAEVDLWVVDNKLWLGHDEPTYEVDKDWLYKRSNKLWVHVKSLSTIDSLVTNHLFDGLDEMLNWFWHENDKVTLTSTGSLWCFPEVFLANSVVNQPSDESVFWRLKLYKTANFIGVCHDNVDMVKRVIQEPAV